MVLSAFHPLHARRHRAVLPPFIRRCGARGENSKFVIVFISISMATKIHENGQFALLDEGGDLTLYKYGENLNEGRRRDDWIRLHFLHEFCPAKEELGRNVLHRDEWFSS